MTPAPSQGCKENPKPAIQETTNSTSPDICKEIRQGSSPQRAERSRGHNYDRNYDRHSTLTTYCPLNPNRPVSESPSVRVAHSTAPHKFYNQGYTVNRIAAVDVNLPFNRHGPQSWPAIVTFLRNSNSAILRK